MASQHSSASLGSRISLGQLDFFAVGKKCAQFVASLFPIVTDHLPHSTSTTWKYFPRYVAYVLRRSRFDTVVVVAAMVLLQRHTEVVGIGHILHDTEVYRLFFASFVIASEAMDRPSYTLEFWFVIGGGVFPLTNIPHIVQEFCRSLDWNIQIEADILIRFATILHEDAGFLGDKGDEHLPSYEEIHRDIKLVDWLDSTAEPHSILQ